MTFRVGVTPDFQTDAKGLLEPALAEVLRGFEWEFLPHTGEAARPEVLDQYDAVIALALRFPAASLAGLQRLAVIARWGVGYDRIDVPACTASDVILAITPEGVRRPVAEGIFTLMFALAKNLRTLDRLCRAGRWLLFVSTQPRTVPLFGPLRLPRKTVETMFEAFEEAAR